VQPLGLREPDDFNGVFEARLGFVSAETDSVAGVRGLELRNVALQNAGPNSLVFQNIFVPMQIAPGRSDICEFESSHPSHAVGLCGVTLTPVGLREGGAAGGPRVGGRTPQLQVHHAPFELWTASPLRAG
jgi:hypothetical protein